MPVRTSVGARSVRKMSPDTTPRNLAIVVHDDVEVLDFCGPFEAFGVTGDDNLFVKMQNGVRLALVAGFVTTAQLDLDYDRSPAPDRRATDRTFALTFGYRF